MNCFKFATQLTVIGNIYYGVCLFVILVLLVYFCLLIRLLLGLFVFWCILLLLVVVSTQYFVINLYINLL